MTTNDQVLAILQAAGIKFNIAPKGVGLKRDGWQLELLHKNNTEYFDYFTGIGHRVVPKVDKAWIMRDYKSSVNLKYYLAKYAKPVTPEVCGIIYSLILDSEALHTSFADWCDNFGYDSDSIKAFNTYQACTDNAKKMRKVIDNPTLELLRDALQDY
jgi:hypothetical protein